MDVLQMQRTFKIVSFQVGYSSSLSGPQYRITYITFHPIILVGGGGCNQHIMV